MSRGVLKEAISFISILKKVEDFFTTKKIEDFTLRIIENFTTRTIKIFSGQNA